MVSLKLCYSLMVIKHCKTGHRFISPGKIKNPVSDRPYGKSLKCMCSSVGIALKLDDLGQQHNTKVLNLIWVGACGANYQTQVACATTPYQKQLNTSTIKYLVSCQSSPKLGLCKIVTLRLHVLNRIYKLQV